MNRRQFLRVCAAAAFAGHVGSRTRREYVNSRIRMAHKMLTACDESDGVPVPECGNPVRVYSDDGRVLAAGFIGEDIMCKETGTATRFEIECDSGTLAGDMDVIMMTGHQAKVFSVVFEA